MSAPSVPERVPVRSGAAGSPLSRLARRSLLTHLKGLRHGCLRVVDASGVREFGRIDEPLRATIFVNDPRFWTRLMLGGSVAAGESYARGLWSSDDLTSLVRILLRNRDLANGIEGGWARLRALAERGIHRFRANTLSGSRRNIAAHYDLGNDFFSTFLDETMTYSCGVFRPGTKSLEEASTLKYDLVCRKLGLGPSHEVLEIGTGWGGFAIHAARHYGCNIVTATISERQREYAERKIRREGLDGQVTVLLEDYRNLSARLARRFDRIVSIEMIEAVGHRYLDAYFGACAELLEDDGMMLLQSIVIADQEYDRYRRSVDFIQRYVFPGGCLPSVTVLCDSMTRATDLRLHDLEDITIHYPTTLQHWRMNFFSNIDRVRELGYSDFLVRLWDFYLSYCEGGFSERSIGDVQMLLVKPGSRPSPVIPRA